MPSAFDSLYSNFAAGQHDDFFGVDVIIRRSSTEESRTLKVPYSDVQFDVMDNDGLSTSRELREWRVQVTDYMFDLGPVEPRAGDQLIDGTTVWEVLAVGDLPAWEMLSGKDRYKLRTRRVA